MSRAESVSRKLSARTSFRGWHSADEALWTDKATGRLLPAATATIFVPLPRRVGPTAKPPFSRSRRLHPLTPHPDSACPAPAGVPRQQLLALLPASGCPLLLVSAVASLASADHGGLRFAPTLIRLFLNQHKSLKEDKERENLAYYSRYQFGQTSGQGQTDGDANRNLSAYMEVGRMSKILSDQRTLEMLSYIRCPLFLPQSVETLHELYRSAYPYPHLVLDNLFPDEWLQRILKELPPGTSDKWVHEHQDKLVKSNIRSAVYLGEQAFTFASILHSAGFLYFLSEITGVKALLPDPYLSGAGYHVVPPGGLFDVHADRNIDFNSGLKRRLAMLIYLNENWKTEYGGQLEFWNQEATECEKVIEPIFNRTVLFDIGDKNFHAVRAVSENYGISRYSFAAYFHTTSENLIPHSSIYAPSIYQDKDPLLKRVSHQVLPPFLFTAARKLLKRS
jgi:2OG-Fe(II) oxygenase superfamily